MSVRKVKVRQINTKYFTEILDEEIKGYSPLLFLFKYETGQRIFVSLLEKIKITNDLYYEIEKDPYIIDLNQCQTTKDAGIICYASRVEAYKGGSCYRDYSITLMNGSVILPTHRGWKILRKLKREVKPNLDK